MLEDLFMRDIDYLANHVKIYRYWKCKMVIFIEVDDYLILWIILFPYALLESWEFYWLSW